MEEKKEQKLLDMWGEFPEQKEGEEVFKLNEYYKDGDYGLVRSMMLLKGEYGKFFMLEADKNDDGNFVKVVCSSTVNKMLLNKVMKNTAFTVPFTMTVKQMSSINSNEYTAIKITRD